MVNVPSLCRTPRRLALATALMMGLFLLAASTAAQAQYQTVNAPGGGPPPLYFSGTDCGASGTFYVRDSTQFVRNAELSINGTVLKSKTYPAPGQGADTLSVGFDSTHFYHESVVTVKMEGHVSEMCLRRV